MVLMALAFFVHFTLLSRVKNQSISQVEQQGLFMVQEITQNLRNASRVNFPEPGEQGASLSLQMSSPENTPIVLELQNEVLSIQEGEEQGIALNAFPVSISGVNFYNLSQASHPGSIRMEFTLSYFNPLGRYEYDYSKTFYATGTLRQNP